MNKFKRRIIVSNKRQLNYWIIPKNANSAVRASFWADEYGIDEYKKIKNQLDFIHNINNYSKTKIPIALGNNFLNFTITRHPYDRFLSLYKDFGKYRTYTFFKRKPRLDTFVKTIIEKWPNDHTNGIDVHAVSQVMFIGIIKKHNFCSIYPIKLVDINDASDFLKGHGIKFLKLNQSKKTTSTLTDEHKDMIYNRYKHDFEKLGYER